MSKEQRLIQIDPKVFPSGDNPPVMRPSQEENHSCAAAYIRRIYITQRRAASGNPQFGSADMARWDGGTDKYGVTRTSVWARLAEHIIQLGADPVEYITAQFKNRRRDRLPLPNQMYSDAAVQRWREHQQHAPKQMHESLKRELASIRCEARTLEAGLGWAHDRAVRYVLCDLHDVHASALVRYCVATEYGLTNVAALFFEQAVLEYAFQKTLYDQVWATLIPAGLRAAAEQLVEQISR